MMRLVWIVLIAVGLMGCAGSDTSEPEPSNEADPEPQNVISGVGTIRHIELEGGFYGIVADDSTRYNPTELSEAFRTDGMRVRFRLQIRDDVMTTQMWGRPVRVLEMERLSI